MQGVRLVTFPYPPRLQVCPLAPGFLTFENLQSECIKTIEAFGLSCIISLYGKEESEMTMTGSNIPKCCRICGRYLTTVEEFTGYRCLDPGHWQAAGLSPSDFYAIARVAAIGEQDAAKRELIARPLD